MDVWQALSHPSRRAILLRLREGALSVGEIHEDLDCSGATLSGHLKALREANLVTAERRGTSWLYRINLSVAEEVLTGLLDLLRIGDAATAPKEEAR